MSAYVAHVTKRNGVAVRVDIADAPSRVHACLQAMLVVGEASRSASARPVDYQTQTTDCRVSITTPVRKSQFGELLA